MPHPYNQSTRELGTNVQIYKPNEEQDNRQYTNEQDGWLTVVLELLDNSSNNIIFNNMNQSCN